MPRSRTVACKSIRRHVSYPGILSEVVRERWGEFGYPSFPPYALELMCFDLRRRRPHWITQPFSRDTRKVQDGLDRELERHYEKGEEARGLLVCAAMCETANAARNSPRGEFGVVRDYVHHSEVLTRCIEQRWRELGYANFSAYVTGLIRYDLLLLGPHKYFNGNDRGSELMAQLDAMTASEFETAGEQLGYLERLVDQVAGRRLSETERDAAMKALVAMLREWAMNPRKKEETGMIVGR